MPRTVFGGGQRHSFASNSIWWRAETQVWLEQYLEEGRDIGMARTVFGGGLC